MFKRAEIVKVLEVKQGRKLGPVSPEMREMLGTLQHNPAFQYLLARFELLHAEAKQQLEGGVGAPEASLRYLQGVIAACKFMDEEVARLTKQPPKATSTMEQNDLETLERFKASIDVIQ